VRVRTKETIKETERGPLGDTSGVVVLSMLSQQHPGCLVLHWGQNQQSEEMTMTSSRFMCSGSKGNLLWMVRCEDISGDASSFVSAAVHDIGNNSDSLSLKKEETRLFRSQWKIISTTSIFNLWYQSVTQ
jgi:hypothetical protein